MKPDPRSKNKTFSTETPFEYLRQYNQTLSFTLEQVSPDSLNAAVALLADTVLAKKRIYVCGNGGSSAIADHLCCDWTKGTYIAEHAVLKTHSLSSNSALFTALANDLGFEEAFAKQIEMFAEGDDVLVAISSSGESRNILNAVHMALARNMKVIGLTGFSGGALKQHSTISLHVGFENYGLVEDGHQVLMHVLSQYLFLKLQSGLQR